MSGGPLSPLTMPDQRAWPPDRADGPADGPCGWEPADLAAALLLGGPPAPALLHRSDGIPLLYPGRAHAGIGEPESMKGWAWKVAAKQVLQAGGKVCVVDFENDVTSETSGLKALGVTDAEIMAGLTYIAPTESWSFDAAAVLARLRAGHGYDLVVVDGVTDGMATMGLDADKNKDAATFDRLLIKPFARAGAAVFVCDHVVKDREGRGRYAIGAQHKLAAIDGATFVFDTIQPFGHEREGVARITLTKDKPGWLRRHAEGKTIAMLRLKSWPDGAITGGFDPPNGNPDDKDGFEPTVLMEKVSRYVETNPGLSKRAVIEAVGGKRDYVVLAVELLATRGYLRAEPGPRGAQLHYSARPYREGDTDEP